MMLKIHRVVSHSIVLFFCIFAMLTLAMTASCKKAHDISLWVTTPDGLKLRAAPDLKGAVIATVPHLAEVKFFSEKPETVNIFGTQGKWTEIIYGDKKGFVFGGFLADSLPTVPEPGSDVHLIDFAKKYFVDHHKTELTFNIRDITPEAFSAIREMFARDTKVRMRAGNLVILTHRDLSDGSGPGMERETLWVWRASGWHQIDESNSVPNTWHLVHLNNDTLIDAIRFEFFDATKMGVWLGVSNTELNYIEGSNIYFNSDYDRVRRSFTRAQFGKCGETIIPTGQNETVDQKSVEITYTFDCVKNSFVKVKI